MANPGQGGGGPGPLGSTTNRPRIDAGTNVVHRMSAPADRYSDGMSGAASSLARKMEYLAIARSASYAMQGRSSWQHIVSWQHGMQDWLHDKTGKVPKSGKAPRVQSILGGAFLRMYLDGKVDNTVVAMAGQSIAESPEFVKLASDLALQLQKSVDADPRHRAAPDHLLVISEAFLKARRSRKDGIAFRNNLNTVIGGVTGAQVDGVELVEEHAEKDHCTRRYRIDIRFTDTYDFENERTGEYDRYRKRLAHLLMTDQYDKFDEEFGNEANPFSKHRQTRLEDAAVFASFMYALEKKGWTPGGLEWSVAVPAQVQLTFPIPHPKPGAAPHGGKHF